MAREFVRALDHGKLLAVWTDLDLVTNTNLEGRDVHLPAIHFDVPVTNDLTSLTTRACKSETESNVIQAALKLLQKQLTGDARGAGRLLVVGAELAFQREVDALGLLLFAQLEAVANDLRLSVATVLARGEVALLNRALVAETPSALQKKLHAFATAKAADCSRITCHFILLRPDLNPDCSLQRPTGLRMAILRPSPNSH